MNRSLLFLLVLMLSACSKPSDFRLEPGHRKIFEAGRNLSEGDIIRVKVTGLGATERLRFHKCSSEECKSAERISIWTADKLPGKDWFDVIVREPGRYYFWVEDFNSKYAAYDANAVMIARSAKNTGKGLQLEYNDRLHIVVKLVCRPKQYPSSKIFHWIQTKAPSQRQRRNC